MSHGAAASDCGVNIIVIVKIKTQFIDIFVKITGYGVISVCDINITVYGTGSSF